MSHLLPWLTDHVRAAAEKCGALGASVYVPTPWNPTASGILVHVGSAAPLPEMAALEQAQAFASQAAATIGASGEPCAAANAVLPSTAPEGCFLPIPLLATLWHRAGIDGGTAVDARGQMRRLSDRLGGPPIVGWLGLRFAEPPDQVPRSVGWQSLLELASALASTYVCFYGILTDPVTGLPGRAELTGTLRAELERAQSNGLPFSLLFARIEDLDRVNERLGRRAGDAVLREFLDVMSGTLRRSDTVMRYGGAVFALPLRDVTSSGALVVGEKVRRRVAEHAFLDGAAQLHCAVGVVSIDGAAETSLQPLDLLRRADQALAVAQRDGREHPVLWRADGDMASADRVDPLLGVFTGQTEKDYRNMRLLWDVVQALSSTTGAELAEAVVSRMVSLFAATRAALFEPRAEGGLRLTAGQERLAGADAVTSLSADDIEPEEWRINDEAVGSLAAQQRTIDLPSLAGAQGGPLAAFSVPLVIDGRALGALYLLGGAETLKADSTDLPVLGSVAAQLAMAFDRERLTEQQRIREQRERQVLRAELDRLRTVLKQEQFVFRSKLMTDLLNSARRVAATDATVLITGESGTGKEVLAHSVHQLSARRAKPLVIVDCGAIPASLMDSELFGRERGAYTGAERRAGGRLAQADGGTIFLDEIGELPLEVQAKLLRFVQEKTITMVGGTRPQRVDVRIIAATNRDLEQEVRAGRFREDLFHRLNVVRLRVPPLRERPDDVLFLARHFLEGFARQYGKGAKGLAPAAEQMLEQYDWPGNVRELQNTLLQAVVLAEGDVVKPADLQLADTTGADSGTAHAKRPASATREMPRALSPRVPPAAPEGSLSFDEARRALVERLAAEILAAIGTGAKVGPPLGRWLARDLVLVANERHGGVAARAAATLGLPETTYSRHLRQAEAEAPNTRKPDSWISITGGLSDLLAAPDRPSGCLADHLDAMFLGLLVEHVPHNLPQAASLMGVSVPTMKRRLAEHRRTSGTETTESLVGA